MIGCRGRPPARTTSVRRLRGVQTNDIDRSISGHRAPVALSDSRPFDDFWGSNDDSTTIDLGCGTGSGPCRRGTDRLAGLRGAAAHATVVAPAEHDRRLRRRAVRHDADRHGQTRRRPAFIDSINADPDVALVLHVGDIHSGKQYCTESLRPAWSSTCGQRLPDPLVYTPGDNEWATATRRRKAAAPTTPPRGDRLRLGAAGNPVDYAGGNPVANLDLVRSIFFSAARAARSASTKRDVARRRMLCDRRHPSDAAFVENVMWEQSGVLFVTINLPGGSNNDTRHLVRRAHRVAAPRPTRRRAHRRRPALARHGLHGAPSSTPRAS